MSDFKNNVLYTIEKHGLIKHGEKVCVAVSGGGDSMALLCFLLEIRAKFDLTISAVNIEHGIRGPQSLRDSEFVKDYCDERKVPFKIFIVDTPNHAALTKQGLEAAARELRYKCFEKLRGDCDKIALAHHRGDQAETVLLRLFRGSGVGLSGIEYVRGGFYIRPFLDITKDEIAAYIIDKGIPHITDNSNADNAFDRNFVRNVILPEIEKRFRGCESALARAAGHIRADNQYIEGMVPDLRLTTDNLRLTNEGGEVSLPFEHFSLHEAILNRLIFKAFILLGADTDIEERHISLIKGLNRDGESGAEIMLPHGIRAIKDYDCVTLAKRESGGGVIYGMPFADALEAGGIAFGGLKVKFEVETACHGDTVPDPACRETCPHDPAAVRQHLYADVDMIPKGAVIRQRYEGDKFKKFGGGTKPLSDFFIDNKIPARQRGQYPLIADGNEILCVCGMEISDKIKVTENTTRMLKIIMNSEG